MDEEAITWNLRGPKRMRRRKDLNKLVKNNVRYKGLFKQTSSFDMLNYNSGTSRLLKSNDSSSENDEYYFSANKQIIKERRRQNCCKLIQMTILGFVITFAMIIGVTLVFSYLKFHEALKDLKDEFQSQKEQNQISLDEIRRKLNHYDSIFKKDLASMKTTLPSSVVSNDLKDRHELNSRSVRNVEAINRIIDHIQTQNKSSSPVLDDLKSTNLIKMIMNDMNSNKTHNVKNHNQVNDDHSNDETKAKALKAELLNNIELVYIKPILESLESCKCPVSSKLSDLNNKSIPL